jgi:hypothetical protein
MQAFRLVFIGLFVLLSLTQGSLGAVVSFNLVWTPAFGSVSAVGTISLDDSLLPNPGSSYTGTAPVVSFSMTVSGSTSKDGTYTLSDYTTFVWNTDGATLDLTRELIGQPTSTGTWGVDKGDFNFSVFSSAPSAIGPFRMLVSSNPVEMLQLTSVTPISNTVPEPSSIAIFSLFAGATGWRIRRKRTEERWTTFKRPRYVPRSV